MDEQKRKAAELAAWFEGRAAGAESVVAHVPSNVMGTVLALAASDREEAAKYRAKAQQEVDHA